MKFREFVSLTEGELTPETRELELYIDNDYQLYKQMFIPQLKNLTRKMKKGIYDRKLAAKLFMYLLDAGAKKYVKEFGSPGDKPATMFPKKDREKLAMRYAMQFEIDYKNQEYDFMKESDDVDEMCGKSHAEGMKDDERRYLTKGQAEKLPEKIKKEIIKKKKKVSEVKEYPKGHYLSNVDKKFLTIGSKGKGVLKKDIESAQKNMKLKKGSKVTWEVKKSAVPGKTEIPGVVVRSGKDWIELHPAEVSKNLQEGLSENLSEQHRPLWQIAQEIKKDWKKVNYAAKPYLEAMGQLDKITDMFMFDSAKSVVLYFLSNASSWRGDKAKKIKAELKAMTK
jgi:hypothetical protein